MIEVEGYKAFKGTMKITPKSETISSFQTLGEWLYKPDTQCWYCHGCSYPSEICEVIKEY